MPTAAKAKPKSPASKKSAAKPASRPSGSHLDQQELDLMDAYWRAANYLSVGQIYLRDNPLLRRPLTDRFTVWVSYTLSRSTRQAHLPAAVPDAAGFV